MFIRIPGFYHWKLRLCEIMFSGGIGVDARENQPA
jgi:hypothetical protein